MHQQQTQSTVGAQPAAPAGVVSNADGHSQGRRSIRLPYYDYAQGGGYFVTSCTHDRRLLFANPAHRTSENDPRAQQAAPLRRTPAPVASGSLAVVVRSFKARVTRYTRRLVPATTDIWQRGYFEHVIRNGAALQRIRKYIYDNPARWSFDSENPRGQPDRMENDFEDWLTNQPLKALR